MSGGAGLRGSLYSEVPCPREWVGISPNIEVQCWGDGSLYSEAPCPARGRGGRDGSLYDEVQCTMVIAHMGPLLTDGHD